MHTILSVKPLDGYNIEVGFDDGISFVFDVAPFLYGEVFEPLKDLDVFRQVRVDPVLRTIVWPTGADFCPDFLYMLKSAPATAKTAVGRD